MIGEPARRSRGWRSTWHRNRTCATPGTHGGGAGDDMHPLVVQRFIERGVDAAITIRRGRRATTIEVGLGGPVTALDEPQLDSCR